MHIPTASAHPWRQRDLAGLLLVFALALALRWGWPGVIDFKLDEASASRLAVAFAHDGWPPLHGVTSSTGVPTPPNAIWVLSPPYFIAPDPLLAAVWIALLSALSVAAGYWLAHRYFGLAAALAAGLLHAVSPWSVYQARKVWTPGALPLFAVLTIATGVLGFVEGRRRWQAVHVFLLAFTVGVHFSALPLALVTVFLVLANRRRIDWRMVAAGIAGAVLITVPFVVGVIQNPNIVMTQDAAIQQHTVRLSAEALALTLQNTLGTNLYQWAVPDAGPGHPIYPPDSVTFAQQGLQGAMLVGFGAVLATHAWRRRRELTGKVGLVALLWLFSYSVVFTVQWTPIFPHYFNALWPAPYLVTGAGVALSLRQPHQRRLRSVGALLVVGGVLAIMAAQSLALERFFTFTGAHSTPGDFGTPLGLKMQAAEAALSLLDTTDAEEIIVIGEGDRPYQHEGPAAFDVMLHDAPHRFVDSAIAVVLPDHPAIILLQPNTPPSVSGWYDANAEEAGRIPLRAGEGEYTLLHYDPAGRENLLARFPPAMPPDRLANGARVLGHQWVWERLDETTGIAQVDIAWAVERAPPLGESYHLTLYYFDPQTQSVVTQVDGPAHWSAYWRAGDIVVNRLPQAPPPQPAEGLEFRAAMYTYPAIERVFAVDAAGNPVADSVLLGRP